MKKTNKNILLGILFLLIAMPMISTAQNVNSIIDGMERNFNQMTDGVNNFTVKQSVFMGNAEEALATSITYFERGENGYAANDVETQTAVGTFHSSEMNNMAFYGDDAKELFNHLRQNAEYRGIETFYGTDVYVLYSDDPNVLAGPDTDNYENDNDVRYETNMKEGFFYVGVDHYEMRGMRMLGESNNNGKISEMEMVFALTDFRVIDGLRYPFTTTMEISGMDMNISAEELAQAKQALSELEKQLSGIPENLRSTMERMIKPQMAQFETIIQSGKITTSIKVLDLQVNAGRPSDG